MAPVIYRDDPVGKHYVIGLDPLPGRHQAQLVESAESGQIRAGETRISGSVKHVEVFQMGSVRTSIFGRPRPLSRDPHAATYTLIWEEPVVGARVWPTVSAIPP